MNAVANVQAGDVNASEAVIDIASARNFHTYVRRATDAELQEAERQLSIELAKSDASGIRTQMVDIIKERLLVVSQALALSN
jgi:hypothetical protein